MALGIGANAAVFSVVDGVLVRPLPYAQPDQIVLLERVLDRADAPPQIPVDGATVTAMRRWNDGSQTIAAIGAAAGVNLVDGDRALHVRALPASHEYLHVLGVSPAQGRRFTPDDERAGAVALVSDDLARRLGGDVVGRRVRLGGELHEVAGVLPRGTRLFPPADLLIPFRMGGEASGTNYLVVARLRGGAGVAAARLGAATAALQESAVLPPRHGLRWTPLGDAMSELRRPTLLLLSGAVALVLLIACANVAGLLLIKSQRRTAELAVRAALGAGPGRLARQLLTEGMVHALVGGVLGVVAAHWALDLLLHLAPPDLADWSIDIDGRVLLFGLAVTVVTGLACGLAPAVRGSRVDLRHAIAGTTTGVASSSPRSRWRRGLLVVQVALCTLLLLGAGLLTRSLVALRSVDPGFRSDGVLALTMTPERRGSAGLHSFYARALDQVRGAPGIRAVAVASGVPGRRGLNLPVRVSGSDEITSAGWRYVSPGYFEMLGIPVRGRSLSDADSATSQPVAVVNSAFARRYFPGGDAIGGQVHLHRYAPEAVDAPRTIVGVVGDTLDHGPRQAPEPRIYVAAAQVPPALFGILHRVFDACWLIDSDLAPAVAADRLGAIFQRLQPGLPFSEVSRLDDVVAGHLSGERFLAWLLNAFALVALCIAGTGIYGVTAYSVSQRAREIAIRMALGASPGRILRGIVGEGIAVAAAGVLLGLLAAWPLGPLLERFLFGAASLDPPTMVAAIGVLLAAALLASLAPAWRAARIDPVRNLRQG
jgi:predicted permease